MKTANHTHKNNHKIMKTDLSQKTHTAMKYKLFSIALACTGIFSLSSCSSTEIVEEPSSTPLSDNITLTLSAPEAFNYNGTRADNGLKLRYVAKLYKLEGQQQNPNANNFVERQDVFKDDVENGKPSIKFSVKPGKYYITIFADYIDASATKDNSGKLPDLFYDTSSNNDNELKMKLSADSEGSKFPLTPVNNDNYDAFATGFIVAKEAEEINEDIVLQRIVSKIKFIATGQPDFDHINHVKLTSLSLYDSYSFVNNTSGDRNDSPLRKLPASSKQFSPVDKASNVLFYYYTIGTSQTYSSHSKLNTLSFTIIPNDDKYVYPQTSIESGTFFTLSNHIYNVKGEFASPSSTPDGPVVNEGDLINLFISEGSDWSTPEHDINN